MMRSAFGSSAGAASSGAVFASSSALMPRWLARIL